VTCDRRRFLRECASVAALSIGPPLGLAGCASASRVDSSRADASGAVATTATSHRAGYERLLILVELKGGNDGLNTVVPYRDAHYYALRPTLAIARDAVVQLSDRAGLHPSLAPLADCWRRGELAILQGVGYPAPNLSHFRSIEIWDTASPSDRYIATGWLTRTFATVPTPTRFAADGFVVGSYDLGPLDGGARAVTLGKVGSMAGHAMRAPAPGVVHPEALAHILRVEADTAQAASRMRGNVALATTFPEGPIGNAARIACSAIAEAKDVAIVRITQTGYDTHANQAPTQARLLGELAHALVALAGGLRALGRYDDALIVTYAEFGRRPHENLSAGTDHGTASVHFALGGRVAGGFLGAPPDLAGLSADGNPAHAIDFRSVYATVLERWWGVDSSAILGGRFPPLPFVRA